jgi:hypothetical protein
MLAQLRARLSFANAVSVVVATSGGLLAALAFAASAPAAPGDGVLGGPPLATADSTPCSDGEFARGVSGHLGTVGPNDVVGAVHMTCLNGASAGFLGGVPTSPRDSLCDPGDVAVGIEGYEGDFIDQIAARCQDDSLAGPVESAAGFGGPGGSFDGPYDCPAGQALVGLTGTVTDDSISMVRNVSITCAPRADTTITLAVKTPRDKAKAKGSVASNQAGGKATITLFKKKTGGFKKVGQKRPTLDAESRYKTSLDSPDARRCKVTAKWPGDVNSNPSSASEKFRC